MDKLSANNVSFFQRPSYFNDSNLFKLEKISLSNQNDSRRNATKILFRKRDGNIWIVVVDKPYDKVKEYLERAVKNRRLSALKKALIQLKVKNLSQALINNSKVCFYNHQVKFFTKNRKIILKLLKLAMLSSNSLALRDLFISADPKQALETMTPKKNEREIYLVGSFFSKLVKERVNNLEIKIEGYLGKFEYNACDQVAADKQDSLLFTTNGYTNEILKAKAKSIIWKAVNSTYITNSDACIDREQSYLKMVVKSSVEKVYQNLNAEKIDATKHDLIRLELGGGILSPAVGQSNRKIVHLGFLHASTLQKIPSNMTIHQAAEYGLLEFVRAFTDQGFDSNVKDENGCAPLHWSVFKDHINVTTLLLQNKVETETKDNHSWTPLHLAVLKGQNSTVALLLQNKANIEAKHKDGYTALHLATQKGHIDIITLLLQNGADINAKENYGCTPLHIAVKNGLKETIVLLLQNGADIKNKEKDGWTPLHLSVNNDLKEIFALLLQNGADINAKENYGYTPLHIAAGYGHKEIFALLLQSGANIEAKDKYGYTPLHIAAGYNHKEIVALLLQSGANIEAKTIEHGYTALHMAAQKGYTDAVSLLLRNNADTEAETIQYGYTPLHIAAGCGRNDTIALLLQNQANIEAKNDYGCTPLHIAVYNDCKETAAALLKQGSDIKAKTHEGNTVLHIAAYKGHTTTFDMLLKKGAYIGKKNNDGQTVLEVAIEENQQSIVNLIENLKAQTTQKLHQTFKIAPAEVLPQLLIQAAISTPVELAGLKNTLKASLKSSRLQTLQDALQQISSLTSQRGSFKSTLLHSAHAVNVERIRSMLDVWSYKEMVRISIKKAKAENSKT